MPAPRKEKPPPFGERFELRLSAKDVTAFQSAADVYGISLALWLRLAAWKVSAMNVIPAPIGEDALTQRLGIRIRSSEKSRFRKNAEHSDLSLGEWMRRSGWHVISKHGGEVELVKLR